MMRAPFSTVEAWNAGFTYSEYRTHLEELLKNNQTTGPDQSDKMVQYAKLNMQRMRRVEKTFEFSSHLHETLTSIVNPQRWLVISEGWCGDAAQSVPALALAARVNHLIELRIVLRDEHPALMDQYLYHGTRSIPKLIIMNERFVELANWGPRPAVAQQIVDAGKRGGLPHEIWVEEVHARYAKDKARSLQQEITEMLKAIR